MKAYEAPELFVDEYVADTMIASSGIEMGGGNPKNGNAGNNQNCWGCDEYAGTSTGSSDACIFYKYWFNDKTNQWEYDSLGGYSGRCD